MSRTRNSSHNQMSIGLKTTKILIGPKSSRNKLASPKSCSMIIARSREKFELWTSESEAGLITQPPAKVGGIIEVIYLIHPRSQVRSFGQLERAEGFFAHCNPLGNGVLTLLGSKRSFLAAGWSSSNLKHLDGEIYDKYCNKKSGYQNGKDRTSNSSCLKNLEFKLFLD